MIVALPMKSAFVAMKFTKPPAKDARYRRIKTVLAEDGYACVRADEIPTSDIVVDEVAKYLASADLVVIDSSGDSHSVSYEIGFCHGAGRRPEVTLLLRSKQDARIPFNYQHYRHRLYGTLGELEKEIRQFLGISAPLPDSTLAYALTYQLPAETAPLSVDPVISSILAAAARLELNGRVEAYFEDGYLESYQTESYVRARTTRARTDGPRLFHLGLACEAAKNNFELLYDLCSLVAAEFRARVFETAPEAALSEGGILREARGSFRPLGVWDLRGGSVIRSYPTRLAEPPDQHR